MADPDGLLKVTVTHLMVNGDISQNVLHFLNHNSVGGEDPTLVDLDAITFIVKAAYSPPAPGFHAVMPNDCTMKNITAVGAGIELSTDFTDEDGQGGDTAPSQLAICVSWRTGLAGRSRRGRTFIGPIAESVIGVDGTIDDTARNQVLDAAQGLITDAAAGDQPLVVFSKVLNQAILVESARVDNRFDVQRRRANRRIV